MLKLNGGNDLPITANGAFSFNAQLAEGATYAVTLSSAPVCPQRMCTLANNTGTIAGADATTLTVTCSAPHYRLVAQSWGDTSVRVTDDLAAIANNGTAIPRIIKGASTMLTNSRLDSVAYDTSRDVIYAASHTSPTVIVFANGATANGNIAPTRSISIAGETALQGIEVDAAGDRLFVTSATRLYVLANASTLTGSITAPVAIPLASPASVSHDGINDRLFVAGDFTSTLYIFNSAATLTSSSTPNKTVTWSGWNGPPAVAIDGCRDRLYLGSNTVSPGGFNMFAFDNASLLSGAIVPDSASQARLQTGPVLSADVDSAGVLWYWPDSAANVFAIDQPQTLAGVVTVTPDKTINAVASSAYGLDVGAY